jgi:DNA helicase-2/ATP-dependent DNA helicase PcrA
MLDLVSRLNPPQREAVMHVDGPLLILAGAGSGKTRVITHRIAWLVLEGHADASQIVAVTFTNKAAQEMRERVDHIMTEAGKADVARFLTISTFHAMGARLMRRHAAKLGLKWSFNILDDGDQQKMIRAVMDARKMEPDQELQRQLRSFIERMKNRGATPQQAHELAHNREDEDNAWFYEHYQTLLRQSNCVDFGDLILGPLELFRANPDLVASYNKQWRQIMVDEFQDTNPAQYELLQHLCSEHGNLTVVGDDDQAIYRWRGATITNILGFESDRPKTKIVKLEQNYRSTQVILDAAHDIIQHNTQRRDKRLWTDQEGGDKIVYFTARDDREEAQYIADRLMVLRHRGIAWKDCAIFFRTNAQARLFEEQLRFAGIAYQLVGTTSFYQREEIKDLMAFLRVALNPVNHVDVLRILNIPPRGVGPATIERLTQAAAVPGVDTMFDAIRYVIGADMTFEGELSLIVPRPTSYEHDLALQKLERLRGAQVDGLLDLFQTIQALRDDLLHFDSLAEALRQHITRLHYADYLTSKNPESAEDRIRNVAELVNAIEEFERDVERLQAAESTLDDDDPAAGADSALANAPAARNLRAFLDQSALIESTDQLARDTQGVTLMTIHGSKGLEFDHVFLSGMEDELFPSLRDKQDREQEEEERRLAYVAITRARKHLTMTNARRRRVYGQFKDTSPSRFLFEIRPERLSIDPKSTSRELDWRPARKANVNPMASQRASAFTAAGDDAMYILDDTWEIDSSSSYATDRYLDSGGWEDDDIVQLSPDEIEARAQLLQQNRRKSGAYSSLRARLAGTSEQDLVGKAVTHATFGIGKVLGVSGEGDKAVITVNFPRAGEKKVVRKFLKVLG